MPDVNHPPGPVRFGAYEVDLRAGELRKLGKLIKLQAQPFRVLELLLEQAGELVTREQLKQKLWPADSFGDFDHGLNKAINKIRDALSDSASSPKFVETVTRRGYRFIAEVEPFRELPTNLEPSSATPSGTDDGYPELSDRTETQTTIRKSPLWKVIGGSVLLILAIFLVWGVRQILNQPSAIRSLAVLPMENLSNDPSQEYFADGMTDELITALGTISGLRVISRTSVMPYKNARRSLREIAHDLQVDAVLEGTVLRSGDQVRITAQLIRAAADENLWGHSYQGDLRDALHLQDQIARDIAHHISLNLTAQEQALLSDTKTVDPVAYDAYLKGRYFWNKRTQQGLNRAIDYFGQAIAKQPSYPQAYSGLADAYALLGDWQYGELSPAQALPKAKEAAIKALKLDGHLGEAHASLAFCLDLFDWDWKSAQAEFQRSITLSPSYATAHQWYGWHLIILGRNRAGMGELRKAERLDPLSLIIGADLADALVIMHRNSESIQQSRKIIEMDPSFAMAHYQLGQALAQVNDYDHSIRELREAIDLSPGNPIFTSYLGYVYAVSGRRDEATKILNSLKNESEKRYFNAANVALVYAGLRNRDQAMTWLEKAYEQRFNPSILARPAFDTLRSDERFQNLLHRLGLPVVTQSF